MKVVNVTSLTSTDGNFCCIISSLSRMILQHQSLCFWRNSLM